MIVKTKQSYSLTLKGTFSDVPCVACGNFGWHLGTTSRSAEVLLICAQPQCGHVCSLKTIEVQS